MKRTIAVILSILILGTFLTGCASEKRIKEAIESVERYQYPIDVNSEDWFEYTVVEKSDMLMIPQETLDDMTDLQLLFATADYPYFATFPSMDSIRMDLIFFRSIAVRSMSCNPANLS